ncbi:hypothetical protein IAU59_003656 [Kwoniella sp. CBS 9459]
MNGTETRYYKSRPAALDHDHSLFGIGIGGMHEKKHEMNTPKSINANANGVATATTQAGREVLASISANLSNPSAHRSLSNRSLASHTIPKPSATPDVFAPEVPTSKVRDASVLQDMMRSVPGPSTSTAASVKRAREVMQSNPNALAAAAAAASAANSSKRARVASGTEHRDDTGARNARAEEEKWRAKWVKVFPTLVFHFEIGAEDGMGKTLRNRIARMGAKVDQFFSTRVTHLIVKGGASPQKPKPMQSSRRGNDPSRPSSNNPFLDGTGVTDLVQKAEAMNMKVWTVKKLADILSRIAPVENSNKDSLSTLLEDEKLHGTRERDFSAPRPDYYYFKPGNKYLLVEDATGKHRTVLVKEYSHNSKEGPEWPILYDGFLRVSSSMQSTVPVEKVRERAWSLYVDREPFEGEQPPNCIKRSTSLRAFPSTPRLPEAQPYHEASGNSVVLTSTTASTSTAGTPLFGGFNGVPGLGANKDRAIMQMSKRVQVLKGNARLAASMKQQEPESAQRHDHLHQQPLSDKLPPPRRASTGFAPPPAKTFMTQDQVVKMLQQAREPVHDPSITVQMRMRNREKVDMGLKDREQDTAAGYCENCRLRYSDLSVHVASKKHRRFAMNDANFADLDRLLYALQRPMHPATVKIRVPLCNDRHEKDAECDKCNFEFGPISPSDSGLSPLSPTGTDREEGRSGSETEYSANGSDCEGEGEGDAEEDGDGLSTSGVEGEDR